MPFESLRQDLRYALRSLRRNPGFTTVCVLTLALGMGANTAIFSVVQGVILRSLPYQDPDRLVRLSLDKPAVGMTGMSLTYGIVTNWQQNARSVERLAAWFETSATLTGDFEPEQVYGAQVVPGFFAVFGFRPMLGRAFTDDTLERRFFPAGAIGRHLRIGIARESRDFEVVGVIADIRQFGIADGAEPNVYVALDQVVAGRMALVVRTSGDPAALMAPLRAAVRRIDPAAPITRLRTLEQSVAGSLRDRRFYASLLSTFSVLSLLLATVGLYGVLSYQVNTRTREIGTRIALGARGHEIMRSVVGHGLLLTMLGIGVGLGAAFMLTRLLDSLLYGVESRDATTFALAAVGLAAVAAVASAIRRGAPSASTRCAHCGPNDASIYR